MAWFATHHRGDSRVSRIGSAIGWNIIFDEETNFMAGVGELGDDLVDDSFPRLQPGAS